MNIELEGYTREQLIAALFSSTRQVRYEYTLTNAVGNHLGYIPVQDGSVSYDSKADIMRTFSGRVKKSDLLNINSIDYRLVPWMCLMMPNGKEAKWPLGKFIIVPSIESSRNINMVEIVGYDMGKIFLDDKSDKRTFVDSTDVYTSKISDLISSIYLDYNVQSSDYLKSYPQEWEIGTSKITIINDLLKAINYDPLHFDGNGKAICKANVNPYQRSIDFQYIANNSSIILDGMILESDKFNVPNKWIRYTENPDAPYLISVYVNNKADSPYSVANRGRMIVDSDVVLDVANQQSLDAYTVRIAAEAMNAIDRVEFSTLNMPGHDYQECLLVDIPEYEISGRFIEVGWEMELVVGGKMRHVCERVIQL